jgi:hypothetical protein
MTAMVTLMLLVLGAVILTESGSSGYYKDGSLKIRFENHLFINWYSNEDLETYFYYNPNEDMHSKIMLIELQLMVNGLKCINQKIST